jgi:hypothetical protein
MRALVLLAAWAALAAAPAVSAVDLPPAVPPNDQLEDPVHRLVFFAVLEGCYRDGVSNEAIDLILPENPDTGGVMMERNFVYGCPLCMPVIEALRTYRVRTRFFDKRARDTFGRGLPPEVMARLAETDRAKRMPALQALVDGWVQARLDLLRATPAERASWGAAIDDRRKRGAQALERLRAGEQGEHFIALYADWPKTCAICDGVAGGAGVPMAAPK